MIILAIILVIANITMTFIAKTRAATAMSIITNFVIIVDLIN